MIAAVILFTAALTGGVCSAAPATIDVAAKVSTKTPSSASPFKIDPDDDNVAEELTYQWNNPRYSNDEKHQMGCIVLFIGSLAVWRLVRRRSRTAQPAGGG